MGQYSLDVIEDLRNGRLEAGLVALPIVNDAQLRIRPVARDEVVYVSAHERRVERPVTPAALAAAPLVLSEATWGDRDFTRQQLSRSVQAAGFTLQPRFEVENVETALEIAAAGDVDTIAARGVLRHIPPGTRKHLHAAPLRPRVFDAFATVYRRSVPLSFAAQIVIRHAEDLMRRLASHP